MKWLSWLLGLTLLIILNSLLTAGATSRPFAFSGLRLDLEAHTALERISTAELMGGTGAAHYSLTVRDPLDFQQGFTTKLTRRLPNLWKVTLPSDFDTRALQVDYTLISAVGKLDSLSAVVDARSEIPVQVFPTPQQVIEQSREFKVLEGGVIINLEVGEAFLAGSYQGTLRVSIYDL